ncbi:MFS transporter [Streptomyces sp. NPDC050560]|uniref:MFS transporter n=1 Tax=Streptomyces sp. NPDC050560 TaxID=3365630 RepID=UPI00379B2D41
MPTTQTRAGTAGPTTAAPPATGAPGGRVTVHPTTVLSGAGLLTVLIGAALPLIDFFIVNVALPTIGSDLHAGEALLELVVAGYGVAYAVLLVLGGRLGDRFGRRRLFIGGMAAFGVTSLACGLAPDAWSLIGARVAQGMAAALMLPQVLATIQATTQGHRRARAMSLYGATAGLSMVAGQILGGVLIAADIAGTDWRAVFLVNVPVVAVALALAVRTVPPTRAARPAPVDLAGTALLAVSLLTLLLPLTEGRAAGWPLWTWAALGVFPFAAWGFYAVERRLDRRGHTPLVPPSLFRLVTLRRGLVLIVPFSMGFSGFMFVMAVALQQGARLGPVAAGLALAPLAGVFFVFSVLGPRLVRRFGTRVVTAGAGLQAVGLLLICLAAWRDWPRLDALTLLPGSVFAGAGQALQLPVIFRVVMSEVPVERAGVGSGVMITTQQSSLALGVAVLGSLFLSVADGGGLRDGLLVTLAVQLAGVAVTAALSTRLPRTVG